VRDRSSGQGASRCHCHAAERDPSATVGWVHPAQAQLVAQLAAQLAADTQGGTGQAG